MASQVWTNAGQAYFADIIDPATRASTTSTFYGNTGSSTTAAAVTDTALGAENAESRATCTVSQPNANTLRFTFTVTFTGSRVVAELGVFSASTGGTMIASAEYPVLNTQSGDQVTFDVDVVLRDGSESAGATP